MCATKAANGLFKQAEPPVGCFTKFHEANRGNGKKGADLAIFR